MSEAEILFEVRGSAGIVTLNRPKALNALTLGMVRALHPKLVEWADDPAVERVIVQGAGEKGFCAGGDIRALYDWGKAGDATAITFYREEYQLNTYIKEYPKPYIALMDGITMGGGVGLSVHGTYRVATERLMFAMPETGIGLFPDVGGTYFLPRTPGATGVYLALTGARLKAADACFCGIATHFVEGGKLDALIEALSAKGADVDAILKAQSADPGNAPLAEMQAEIEHLFGADTVEFILETLDADDGEWAAKQAEILRAKSPTSLKVARRQMAEGCDLDFRSCMQLEYRLVNRVMQGHDFYEGVRATIIDKDGAPKWEPATLAEVSDETIAEYFEPVPASEGGDLQL